MLFSASKGPLNDIRRNIELALAFTQDMTFAEFKTDRKTVDAVIRCLEIISEASRRLPGDIKVRHPEITWPNIAGAGNVYRHDYEDIEDQMVWNTVQGGLLKLRTAVEQELGSS